MRAGQLGAGADCADEPALGDAVEGGQGVRERQRMTKQRQKHRRAEDHASGRAGESCEEGYRFAAGTSQQGVARPHRVVSGLFRLSGCIQDYGQIAVRPEDRLAGREQESGFLCSLRHCAISFCQAQAIERLKEGERWMWSLGDYPRVAQLLEPGALALAEACVIAPGTTVLDVAAATATSHSPPPAAAPLSPPLTSRRRWSSSAERAQRVPDLASTGPRRTPNGCPSRMRATTWSRRCSGRRLRRSRRWWPRSCFAWPNPAAWWRWPTTARVATSASSLS